MKSKVNGGKTRPKGLTSAGTRSPNTTAPSVSGAYIQFAQKGELQRLFQLRKKLTELESELKNTSESLSVCNDPNWLEKFAKARGNKGRRFTVDLELHTARLDKRKAQLIAQKDDVLNRIRQISNPVPKEIFSSLATPLAHRMLPEAIGKPRVARRTNLEVQQRDLFIRKFGHLSNGELCTRLDFDFSHEGFALPKTWYKGFGVKTWAAAYGHPECKGLVQKLIWKAKSTS
jgi:hypothetical protein